MGEEEEEGNLLFHQHTVIEWDWCWLVDQWFMYNLEARIGEFEPRFPVWREVILNTSSAGNGAAVRPCGAFVRIRKRRLP